MSSQLDVEVLLNEYLLSAESSLQNDMTGSSGKTAMQQHEDDIIRAVDFLYGKTTEGALAILDAPGSISKVVSMTSQRSIYCVKGSSAFASRGKGTNSEDTYLCMIPQASDDVPIYFCSCRSFMERNRHLTNESSCLCKHLLALRLMPVLQVQPVLIETASDDEFANLLMQRIPSE